MIYSRIFLCIMTLFTINLAVHAEWIDINKQGNIKIRLEDSSINKRQDCIYYAIRYSKYDENFRGDTSDKVSIIQSKGSKAGVVETYEFYDYENLVLNNKKMVQQELINKISALNSAGVNQAVAWQETTQNSTEIKQKCYPTYTTKTAKKFKDITPDSPLFAANEQAWKIANEKYSATGVVKNTAKGFVKDTINDTKAKGIIRGLTNVLKEFDSY